MQPRAFGLRCGMPTPNSSRRMLLALALTAVLLLFWGAYRLAAPSQGPADAASLAAQGSRPRVAAPAEAPRSARPAEAGKLDVDAVPRDRRQALAVAVARSEGREMEGLLTRALRDPDVELRREALALSADLASEEVNRSVLPLVLQDEDARLRDLAILRVNQLPVAQRVEFFAAALNGARDDTARQAAQWLAVLGGKASVHALITAWPRVDSAQRAAAIRQALQRLTGHDFAGSQAAMAWWAETEPGLNEDLLPSKR